MFPIITLTTDFGHDSPYVAEMKAAIMRVRRDVHLIDITHSIVPQNVRQGAVVLETATRSFPDGSIHVAVVDPGVGTTRAIIGCEIAGQYYVAPDNGLLSLVKAARSCRQIIAIDEPKYWHHPVSTTFHGRDIMAPVAAHLAAGTVLEQLGSPRAQIVELDWPPVEFPAPDVVRGSVLWIDSFGNVITNIERRHLAKLDCNERLRVTCQGHICEQWVDCYGQGESDTLIALIGSSDRLELAVRNGSAAAKLGACPGETVAVSCV